MPSTAIRDIAYDANAQTLDVTFIQSGRRYRYFHVMAAEHEALMLAFSKGTHFNQRIKPFHEFQLIYEPPKHATPPAVGRTSHFPGSYGQSRR
jgi:hypothetical protein